MTTAAGVVPGVCRYCGCEEFSACTLPDGDHCSWLNSDRTVCNAPECIRQYHVDDVAARRRDYLQLRRAHRRGRRKKSAA